MAFSLAAIEERSANWLDRQRDAVDEINAARNSLELAIAKHETAKAKVRAARLVHQQAQMPVHQFDTLFEHRRLKALLALRNAELSAVRAELAITKARTRVDVAYWQREQVAKGEGFTLAA